MLTLDRSMTLRLVARSRMRPGVPTTMLGTSVFRASMSALTFTPSRSSSSGMGQCCDSSCSYNSTKQCLGCNSTVLLLTTAINAYLHRTLWTSHQVDTWKISRIPFGSERPAHECGTTPPHVPHPPQGRAGEG